MASACGCTKPDRHIQSLPRSSACGDPRFLAFGGHGGCTGFTDGYETYHCGCSCHWCPSGLHLREKVSRG